MSPRSVELSQGAEVVILNSNQIVLTRLKQEYFFVIVSICLTSQLLLAHQVVIKFNFCLTSGNLIIPTSTQARTQSTSSLSIKLQETRETVLVTAASLQFVSCEYKF